MGKGKFLLPIRLCIFLMRAMVMIYVRQIFFCGHRAVGLSHDFLDIYQFPHRISNKIVALAVSQEWWDLFSMTNYYRLCWEDNMTTQHAVEPPERSTLPQDILPHSYFVDSCECQNRDENHLIQTLAHHKKHKAYQINCISYFVERNTMFMPICYQKNHEKETCSEL